MEQLLARYNAEGPEALGDMRRRNGASATILKPDLLAKLRVRLDEAPPDGGLREPQGGNLDGWRTRLGVGRATTGLGGFEGDRLVDPEATQSPNSPLPEERQVFKKSSWTLLPRRPRSSQTSRLRILPQTSTASA